MHSQRNLLSSASILALLVAATTVVSGTALATDLREDRAVLPAVSGANAKVGAFGASLDGESAAGAFAALSFPLGHGFGAQFDGLIGDGNGGNFHGFGGHLFWRDPSRGLLGVYASYLRWNTETFYDDFWVTGAKVGKIGAESHLYLGPLTLEGIAAYQFGSETGFAGKATVAYYPRDNLRLYLGVNHLEGPGLDCFHGRRVGTVGPRDVLFADVGFNEDHDTRVLAGVKFYLSHEDKSLIRRHREDDPDIDLPGDLFKTFVSHCPAGYAFAWQFLRRQQSDAAAAGFLPSRNQRHAVFVLAALRPRNAFGWREPDRHAMDAASLSGRPSAPAGRSPALPLPGHSETRSRCA